MRGMTSGTTRFRTNRFNLAVFRQRYAGGKYSRSWYYRQMVCGRTYSFPLGVEKKEAGKLAEQIFAYLQNPQHSIEDAIKIFNPRQKEKIESANKKKNKPATIGDVLTVYFANLKRWGVSESSGKTAKSKLLAGLRRAQANLNDETFVSRSGAKIDYSDLLEQPVYQALTANVGYAMQNSYLSEAEDEDDLVTKKITANSVLTGMKAIFAQDQYAYYLNSGLNLPDRSTWSFLNVKPLKGAKKHRKLPARIVISKLLKGYTAIIGSNPEAYKAALLALHCSCRRKEAAASKWEWFQVEDSRVILQIPDTDGKFKVKWGQGRRVIVERWVYDELLSLRDLSSPYIMDIEEGFREGVMTKNQSSDDFDFLNKWLRSKGLEETMPYHSLRALWFSAKVRLDGLLAAQQQGGHKDPKTTSDSYADNEMPDELLHYWRPDWNLKKDNNQNQGAS